VLFCETMKKKTSEREMSAVKPDNTFAVNLKIPEAWIETVDRVVASERARTGFAITRTDVIRKALGEGLDAMWARGLGG
jgi:hypothetical protein